jgi:hypothetical protein
LDPRRCDHALAARSWTGALLEGTSALARSAVELVLEEDVFQFQAVRLLGAQAAVLRVGIVQQDVVAEEAGMLPPRTASSTRASGVTAVTVHTRMMRTSWSFLTCTASRTSCAKITSSRTVMLR